MAFLPVPEPGDGGAAGRPFVNQDGARLPYDQLWAVDDQGARYAVRLEGGRGETVTWFGVARLSPVPPRHVRRLDLVGDEPVAIGLGERLLERGAVGRLRAPVERLLADPGTLACDTTSLSEFAGQMG